MSPEFLTIGMFATLILFIVLGLPLAYSLAGTAVIFGLIENGFNIDGLLGFFINNAWGTMNNFVLVAVPLFILMAQLLDRAKISDALFEALYVVMGAIKGGLGLAVLFVCVILAATTGIVGASVVGMTLLAGPKLLEKGYNKEMAAGLICSGGTLGILIPPSIMLVVYGGLTGLKETSVGALFAAAILPGLLLSFLYMAYVFIVCQVKPAYGPPISKQEASGYSATAKNVDGDQVHGPSAGADLRGHGHHPRWYRYTFRGRGSRCFRCGHPGYRRGSFNRNVIFEVLQGDAQDHFHGHDPRSFSATFSVPRFSLLAGAMSSRTCSSEGIFSQPYHVHHALRHLFTGYVH